MFAIDYRPKRFDDVIGHAVVKKVLLAALNNPDLAPKTFLLVGSWGTGKTSLAQIFGAQINCLGIKKPCYKCKNCTDQTLYHEIDSSVMGNVQSMKQLQETLYYSIGTGYRVVVIDEIQVASTASQASFLKVLENPPDRTFFLLLTTDSDSVLNTIISRSMELNFYLLSDEEINRVLSKILNKVDKEVPNDVKNVIIRRANGHARDAVTLLEMALMVGDEDFLKSIKINDNLFELLFKTILNGGNPTSLIEDIVKSPIAYLKVDFERYILSLFKSVFGSDSEIFDGNMGEKELMKLLNYYTRFKPLLSKSTSEFYSVLLGLKTILRPQEKPSKNNFRDRFSKG